MVLNMSKELVASILYPEDGGSRFILTYAHNQLDVHGAII